MPVVPAWDDFFASAQALFLAAPSKTRLLVKYRHCDAKLEVKITDDSKTFKFITDNTADQRKVDHLTGWLATEACNPERAPPPPAAAPAPAPSTASRVHNPRPKMSGAQRRKAVRAARAAGGGSASVLSGGEAARANQTAGQRAKVAAKVAKAAARKARRDERKLLRNAAAALASSGIAPK